jgi:hypothetical protein
MPIPHYGHCPPVAVPVRCAASTLEVEPREPTQPAVSCVPTRSRVSRHLTAICTPLTERRATLHSSLRRPSPDEPPRLLTLDNTYMHMSMSIHVHNYMSMSMSMSMSMCPPSLPHDLAMASRRQTKQAWHNGRLCGNATKSSTWHE